MAASCMALKSLQTGIHRCFAGCFAIGLEGYLADNACASVLIGTASPSHAMCHGASWQLLVKSSLMPFPYTAHLRKNGYKYITNNLHSSFKLKPDPC